MILTMNILVVCYIGQGSQKAWDRGKSKKDKRENEWTEKKSNWGEGESWGSYKDEKGIKHIVHNKCPHLGCSLIFNEVEKTWDCPCHSSRFDIDGKCIKGPSNYDISYKK